MVAVLRRGDLVSAHLQPVMGGQRLVGDAALLRPAEWEVRRHWWG